MKRNKSTHDCNGHNILLRFSADEWAKVRSAIERIGIPVRVGPYCKQIILRNCDKHPTASSIPA